MADDNKVIFSMTGVTKTYSRTNKTVLKDIYLSFFYGAKIGILGLNGAGKSTLLKIIAGIEKEYQGDVVFSPGYSVGYLPQDPQLDPDKTVLDIVKEGVADTVAILDEYNRINEQFGLEEVYSDPDKMDELMRRQGGRNRRQKRMGTGYQTQHSDGCFAHPRSGNTRIDAFGRGTPPRCPVPPFASGTRRAVAGRAHQPSGCRKHTMA